MKTHPRGRHKNAFDWNGPRPVFLASTRWVLCLQRTSGQASAGPALHLSRRFCCLASRFEGIFEPAYWIKPGDSSESLYEVERDEDCLFLHGIENNSCEGDRSNLFSGLNLASVHCVSIFRRFLVLVSCLLSCQLAIAQGHTVSIFFQDYGFFNGQLANALSEGFEVEFPDHTNHVFVIDTPFWRTEESIKRELSEALAELSNLENGSIEFLMISSHGDTFEEKDEEGNPTGASKSVLQYLGAVHEDSGPDEEFLETLKDLKNKLKEDGTVYLNSCSTLCGSDESAENRVRHFMKFLGNERGSLYGAVVPVYTPIGPKSLGLKHRIYAQALLGVTGAMSAVLAIGAAVVPELFEDPGLHVSFGLAVSAVVPCLATKNYQVRVQDALTYTEDGNRGRLYQATGGSSLSYIEIDRHWTEMHRALSQYPKLCSLILERANSTKR